VVLGHLDEADAEAVGVGHPRLAEAPGPVLRRLQDGSAGRRQAGGLGVDVPDLEPEAHRPVGGPEGLAVAEISRKPVPRKYTTPVMRPPVPNSR